MFLDDAETASGDDLDIPNTFDHLPPTKDAPSVVFMPSPPIKEPKLKVQLLTLRITFDSETALDPVSWDFDDMLRLGGEEEVEIMQRSDVYDVSEIMNEHAMYSTGDD